MTVYVELEIGLQRGTGDGYRVELSYRGSDGYSSWQLASEEPPQVQFDLPRLRELQFDAEAYGRHLGSNLFADPTVEQFLGRVSSAAQAEDAQARLRLAIDPEAPELHSLCWEALCDPQEQFLLHDGTLLFSRYTGCQGMRLRPQADLRTLAVVASPANLRDPPPGTWQPPAPDVETELAQIRSYLDPLPVTALASGGAASLQVIVGELGGGYEVLYLVCQATVTGGEVWLWLEDGTGHAAVVPGSKLIAHLRRLKQRPRVVVLAPCLSSGGAGAGLSSDEGALAALGPRLAELGIPAVLAMQGNVSKQTLDRFMPRFFRVLWQNGQIDLAMAVARNVVGQRPDWWVPVLFTCARSGRLWYVPGFASVVPEQKTWGPVLRTIASGRCTPILGPGLIEPLVGSYREIARAWAEKHDVPVAAPGQEDLAQVAQYLAISQDPNYPRDELLLHACAELAERFGQDLTDEQRAVEPERLSDVERAGHLCRLISVAGERRRVQDPAEPYCVLAQLPLPIYITAEPTNLLADALTEAGRDPVVESCRWNEEIEALPSIIDRDPVYVPSLDRPLVYHLFGHVAEPETLALTEDDYFQYLINVTGNVDLFPSPVRRALADSALLFLGFETDSRSFTILYRSITAQGSVRWRRRYRSIMQMEPGEGYATPASAASRYQEQYFGDALINIYWGTVEHFLDELWQRWSDMAHD